MPPKTAALGGGTPKPSNPPSAAPSNAPPADAPAADPVAPAADAAAAAAAEPTAEEKERDSAMRAAAQLTAVQRQLEVTRSVGHGAEGSNKERILAEARGFRAPPAADAAGAAPAAGDAAAAAATTPAAGAALSLEALAERVMALYHEKEGDVLSEMVANLRFPELEEEEAEAAVAAAAATVADEARKRAAAAPHMPTPAAPVPAAEGEGGDAAAPAAAAAAAAAEEESVFAAPDPADVKRYADEARLAVLAKELQRRVRSATGAAGVALRGAAGAGAGAEAGTAVELLVLRQATQAGPDVDRDLGFAGVPPPRRRCDTVIETDAWRGYADEHGGFSKESGRNGSVLEAVTAAMSAVAEAGGGEGGAGGEAAARWVKWLCTLWALCPAEAAHPTSGVATNTDAYFAVGAGEVEKEVVDAHRALPPGGTLFWDAPRTCVLGKREALGAARGEAGQPTEEKPGSLVFTVRRAAHMGKAPKAVSQYPDEATLVLPPFAQFRVEGNSLDRGNTLGEGLLLDLRPTTPEGFERGGRVAEFLQRVRNDAVAASERLQVGQRRRMEEVDPQHTYTYAEKANREGPKHTSIPKDTAWQEMLWVVERAEEIADDSHGWVGDSSLRPSMQDRARPRTAATAVVSSPQRVNYAWPPPSAVAVAVSPRAHAPASPALARHDVHTRARYGAPPVPPARQYPHAHPGAVHPADARSATPPSPPPTPPPVAAAAPPHHFAAASVPSPPQRLPERVARASSVPWEGGRGGPPALSPPRQRAWPDRAAGPRIAPAFAHHRPQEAAPLSPPPPLGFYGVQPPPQQLRQPSVGGSHSARWASPNVSAMVAPQTNPVQYPVVYPSGRGI